MVKRALCVSVIRVNRAWSQCVRFFQTQTDYSARAESVGAGVGENAVTETTTGSREDEIRSADATTWHR